MIFDSLFDFVGLCGDFNGETFHEMKNTIREEQTNSTKFAASWLVHGDSCEDPSK